MIRIVLRGLAERRLRSALTTVAIVIGVAMMAGAAVQTDRIRAALDTLSATSGRGTAVVVQAREAFASAASGPRRSVDAALAARLRGIDGVARVEGRIEEAGALLVDGRPASTDPGASRVLSAVGAPFDPLEIVRGRTPRAAGEVVVTRGFADEHDVAVGARTAVSTRSGVHPVTVVGVADYGGAPSAAGTDLVVPRLADAQRWYEREGRVTQLLVAAAPGVSDATLARRVAEALPDGVEARTGADAAHEDADAAADEIASFLTPALTALAGAALLVGAFIIFNTFSVTVAQRTREFAVLRALGATRRAILGAVLAEAAVLGVVASVVGLFAGLGIALLLGRLTDSAGLGVPSGDLVLGAGTVVTSLAVGIGTTLLAAVVPAVRATRVAPVAAMRAG
ncbi:ABC transporter permease, partial [Patulibacter sp. S7RM1-6]